MRRLIASALLLTLLATSGAAKDRHASLRVHAQANAVDGAPFAATARSKFSGKNMTIEKTPRLSERDVMAFYPYPAADGTFGALFEFDAHGKIALDTLSVEKRGGFLFIYVNGRHVTEMQIDRRVSDGRIYVESGLNAADIELMKKDWRLIGKRKK